MIWNSFSMFVRTRRELEVPFTENSGWSEPIASIETDTLTVRPSRHPRAICFTRFPSGRASRTASAARVETPCRGTRSGRTRPPIRTFARRHAFDGRVPAVEVHRRVRLEEPDPSRRLDAVRIRVAGFDLREDEVRRAVQDALEGFDPRAAECLLKQVEDRRPVHHGPFVPESNVIPACELAQQPIVVDDRALVRGDHVLAGPKCGEDMIEGDLAGSDSQRGDLDDHVRSSPTNVFGSADRNPTAARFQGDARVRQAKRLPHVDPGWVLDGPVPSGQDRPD